MPWNPDRYHQFQAQRAAPFEDALALVNVRSGLTAVDLGCGTGELTRRLADALPDCNLIGLDSSPEMLAKAAAYARPGLRFGQGQIEDYATPADLIFSHAALQWVEGHEALIPRLFGLVRPGGQLVVQMPTNHHHISHRLIREVAREAPFVTLLGGWERIPPLLPMERYAELLFAAGAESLTLYEKIYPHVLENADAVADWTQGTALVPYAERLGTQAYAEYMAVYRARLREAMPESPVFYGFRRILFAATKPA